MVRVTNIFSLEVFLGNMITAIIRLSENSRYYLVSADLTDFPAKSLPTPFNVLFRQYADLSLFRLPIAILVSTGILTCCPSTSPFGFALGPD